MLNAVTVVTVLLLMLWVTLIFDVGKAPLHAHHVITPLLGQGYWISVSTNQ